MAKSGKRREWNPDPLDVRVSAHIHLTWRHARKIIWTIATIALLILQGSGVDLPFIP